ncbi:MAG: hypothetical protein RSC76_00160 [Oscillospiraceae bacterium]
MKKIVVAVLSIILCTLALTACSAPKTESTIGLPNPMQECPAEAYEDSFAAVGITGMKAPAKAQDIKYFTYSGTMVEIQFELDGIHYDYRAAKSTEDISGVHENFEEQTETVPMKSGEATLKTAKNAGVLANWKSGEIQYSLYGTTATADSIKAILTEIDT